MFHVYVCAVAQDAVRNNLEDLVRYSRRHQRSFRFGKKVNPTYSYVIHADKSKICSHHGKLEEDKSRYAQAKENWTPREHEEHADAQSTL